MDNKKTCVTVFVFKYIFNDALNIFLLTTISTLQILFMKKPSGSLTQFDLRSTACQVGRHITGLSWYPGN